MGLFGGFKRVVSFGVGIASTYVKMQSGIGIAQIAHSALGSSGRFREILKSNNIGVFNPINEGFMLRIPTQEEIKNMGLNFARNQATKAVERISEKLANIVDSRGNSCLSGEIQKAGSSLIDWIF